jgi:hypothetical protein
MNMNISIIQISSKYHLKFTKWFHREEDNSRIVPKTPRIVHGHLDTGVALKMTIGIRKMTSMASGRCYLGNNRWYLYHRWYFGGYLKNEQVPHFASLSRLRVDPVLGLARLGSARLGSAIATEMILAWYYYDILVILWWVSSIRTRCKPLEVPCAPSTNTHDHSRRHQFRRHDPRCRCRSILRWVPLSTLHSGSALNECRPREHKTWSQSNCNGVEFLLGLFAPSIQNESLRVWRFTIEGFALLLLPILY